MGIQVRETGFTIVEVMVTLTLAALFLAFFVQMFESIAAQQFTAARQATANNIALSNLDKFIDVGYIDILTGSPYECNSTNNLADSGSADGTVLLDNNSTYRERELYGLPNPVQEVRAYSPLGCENGLVKIESRVTYGFTTTQGEAIHATYIK